MIKRKFFALFKRKAPIKPVGKVRYNFGLLIFLLGNLGLFGLNYLPFIVGFELPRQWRLYFYLACDITVIISFFVLGAQFWEKLKKLITWEPESEKL